MSRRAPARCYAPAGCTGADEAVLRNARSFQSELDAPVHALSFRSSHCIHREIRAFDHDEDWSWAAKLDGVSTGTEGCEAG